MSFESRILAFGDRFLSDRTVELVVTPALADLQFDPGTAALRRVTNRLAVIRAVAGGVCDDASRSLGGFLTLALLPAGYFIAMLALCADFFPSASSLAAMAGLVALLSLSPVLVCYWPERRPAPPAD